MRAWIGVLGVAAIGAACAGKGEEQHAAVAAPHWTYAGEAGPEHWGVLDPAFATCASGQAQSPVNIAALADVDLPSIGFRYAAGPADILHNGHTVQVNFQPGSAIELEGRRYDLKQFHFHAPAENQVNGKVYPAEAHFVHADSSGALAVVGVMIEEGKAHAALDSIWAGLPAGKADPAPLDHPVHAASLMPGAKDYYRFAGSLTTPPCSEGVKWMVLKQPVTASMEQLSKLTLALGEANARPVQPLNGRVIEQ